MTDKAGNSATSSVHSTDEIASWNESSGSTGSGSYAWHRFSVVESAYYGITSYTDTWEVFWCVWSGNTTEGSMCCIFTLAFDAGTYNNIVTNWNIANCLLYSSVKSSYSSTYYAIICNRTNLYFFNQRYTCWLHWSNSGSNVENTLNTETQYSGTNVLKPESYVTNCSVSGSPGSSSGGSALTSICATGTIYKVEAQSMLSVGETSLGDVYSDDETAYPNNGAQDGYWYIRWQ